MRSAHPTSDTPNGARELAALGVEQRFNVARGETLEVVLRLDQFQPLALALVVVEVVILIVMVVIVVIVVIVMVVIIVIVVGLIIGVIKVVFVVFLGEVERRGLGEGDGQSVVVHLKRVRKDVVGVVNRRVIVSAARHNRSQVCLESSGETIKGGARVDGHTLNRSAPGPTLALQLSIDVDS